MEKYYTIRQAAPLLGIKTRTVRDWIAKGKLNATKFKGAKMWTISENEIIRIQGVSGNDKDKN